MESVKTVILAAGEGSRMKSKSPKVLHKILGKTMIEHVIGASLNAGSKSVCIVVGHMKDEVIAAVDYEGVTFAEQQQQLGTGHAVMTAKAFIGTSGTVLVLYGDTPLITGESLIRLINTHRQQKNEATFMTTVLKDPKAYGRIVRESGQFQRVVEFNDANYEEKQIKEINAGIYCFEAKSLQAALEELKNNNSQSEYYLPDVISILMDKGHKISPLLFEDPSEFEKVNTKVDLALVTGIMQRRINKAHMLNGVDMLSPGTVFIDADVTIGADTKILPGTILESGTQIGEDAVIGPNSRIINSKIGTGCKVISSLVIDSVMEDFSDCGPFAHLRPNTRLGQRVHVGDFVELKNVTVGEGTKIPHLSYVGDAEIGDCSNLGCGTVTANYDGVKKFKTKIGSGAFIGCHTCLVAPVSIGDDAYTASGTVVTLRVPDGALAIGRIKQANKEGWRAKSGKKKG
jgi:bifunctional UDP-N-acetylglucosamine pyrophosphorylase/glucosamine-1-phosphate N-acetyltransferase